MKRLKVLVATALLVGLSITARADAVTEWNAIAVQTVLTAGASRPGPSGFLDVAMVQAAVYDAVQAIERRHQPYFVEVPGASGSPAAAAAKAAHDVLVNRFPAQTLALDTAYQQYLANNGILDTNPGIAVGAEVAARLIAARSCDGSFPAVFPPFIGGLNPGEWRPTPPGNLPMAAPWMASMTPFTLTRPSQFRGDGPPALTSRKYARDYNEVKLMGSLTNSGRNAEQTDQAQFWAGNFLVIWNQGFRDIAVTHIDNIADSARFFALVELSIRRCGNHFVEQ